MTAKMDSNGRFGFISSHSFLSTSIKSTSFSSSSYCYWTQNLCVREGILIRKTNKIMANNNGNNAYTTSTSGDKYSTDWDKAWSSFRKQGNKKKKKSIFFLDFSPYKYVSWNPGRSEYPLSEDVAPIKRTERSKLVLWTSPGFTHAGAIVLVTFLLLYTILAPIK